MTELILLAAFLILSGFFSASEMAYLVMNKAKMEVKARKHRQRVRHTVYFIKNPERFFSTILVGNNIVNLGFASVSTVLLVNLLNLNQWWILLVSTTMVLIFGELLPKFLAKETADRIFPLFAPPLRWLSVIFSPVSKLTTFIVRLMTHQRKLGEAVYTNYFDREALGELVKESAEAGAVGENESTIISKVLQLRHQNVSEAMRPRTEVTAVDISTPISEVFKVFLDSGFSKIPVYDGRIDNIKGVLLAHDLYKNPSGIQEIMREVIFVPEMRKSIDMLNDFINKRVSFAVVVDEFGGTAGIVTLEDIMEELFGEIKDEYDIEEDICRKTAENTYLISGKIEIDFLNETFFLGFPRGDFETVSGFITANIGRIPAAGEEILIGSFKFMILRATLVRIESVKLIVQSE